MLAIVFFERMHKSMEYFGGQFTTRWEVRLGGVIPRYSVLLRNISKIRYLAFENARWHTCPGREIRSVLDVKKIY